MHHRAPSKECNNYVTYRYTLRETHKKMYGGKMWSQLRWLHRTWRPGLHKLVIWRHACYGTRYHLHCTEYREIWWLIPTPDACFWLISLVFNVIIDLVFEKMSFWNEYRQIHINKNIGHFADWCYVFLFLSITTWWDLQKKSTHCGLVTPFGDIDLSQHWFQTITCCPTAPSHYLSKYWLIIS